MRGRMEGEKKRKRAEKDAGGGGRRKEREAAAEEAELATPTDEEVDEFFTILRRMQVAVKYFKKGGSDSNAAGAGHKLTGRSPAAALEAEVLAGVKDVQAAEERVFACGVQKKDAFSLDLNAVPEAESNSL